MLLERDETNDKLPKGKVSTLVALVTNYKHSHYIHIAA